MSFVDLVLGLAGMPDKDIADLDAAWPGMARLAAEAREAEPYLTQAKPHLDALMPLLVKLWPIGQRAWPDIVAVTPTIEELVQFINAKQQQG